MPKVVKIAKYPNRKYYSYLDNDYISAEDIILTIQNGDDVEIQDKVTEKDITKETLLRILFRFGFLNIFNR